MEIAFRCRESSDGLSVLQRERIKSILEDGGLCILPSDSSYILTGFVIINGVSDDLDAVLDRRGMAMSLAFGNIEQIDDMLDLPKRAYDFLRLTTPGGVTFVARVDPRNVLYRYSKRKLHADGTIGVRLTESKVETQLAALYPIPTTPIRNSNGKETTSPDEAVSIIEKRLSSLNIQRRIAVIDGAVPYPGRLSTVIKEKNQDGYWNLVVLRKGTVSVNVIKDFAKRCGYRDALIK